MIYLTVKFTLIFLAWALALAILASLLARRYPKPRVQTTIMHERQAEIVGDGAWPPKPQPIKRRSARVRDMEPRGA